MEGVMYNSILKNHDLPLRHRGTEKGKSKYLKLFSVSQCLCGKKLYFAVVLLFLISVSLSFAETHVELNNKAVQLMNHGNFDDALTYLLKAREISPTDESVQKNLASCYTLIGNRKMSEGKPADAISDFKSALYYSDDPNIRFYKGYAHYRLKEYDDAVYELEKAADSGLSSPDLFILIGKAFYDKGEMVSAVTSWNKGVGLYPENRTLKELLTKAERETKAEEGFAKDNTYHFTVQYDAGKDEDLGRMVLDILEEAYSDVNLDLAHYPEGNTVVVLYTQKAFKEATQGPDWSGGVYDGKIRLPVGGIKEVTDQLKAALYHEYAHVVVRSMTGGKRVPTWLNEGIAEYEGARFIKRPLKELTRAAKDGSLPHLKRLEGSFSALSGKESHLAYLQSYSIVNYIIDRFGTHAVRDILENIGRGDKTEDAVRKGVEAYSLDYDRLVAEWELSLR